MKPINVKTTPIILEVTNCARCRKTHKIEFYKIKHKKLKNWYVGLCENKQEPVVMGFTLKEDKCPKI